MTSTRPPLGRALTRFAGTRAVISVDEVTVKFRVWLPIFTAVTPTKFFPVIVNVRPAPAPLFDAVMPEIKGFPVPATAEPASASATRKTAALNPYRWPLDVRIVFPLSARRCTT